MSINIPPVMNKKQKQKTRYNWKTEEILKILETPLLDLLHRAREVHKLHHKKDFIQRATLLSVKTGGCPEDCAYCPQSAHYNTDIKKEKKLDVKTVVKVAKSAKDNGASRFCMGAAWREVKDGPEFDSILTMVRNVKALGMETCVTLGMLNKKQAEKLADAGLTAYNHNIDTSPNFYKTIITTRAFKDRLKTLRHVHSAGISVCSGGIIGMGETNRDRCTMLKILSNIKPHPESVPINILVKAKGTPLAEQPNVESIDIVRMCATARILMPKARVRLSAGRSELSRETQILCFLAGANSIFYGEKLLTTKNNDCLEDVRLLKDIGIKVSHSPKSAQN